MLFLRLWSTVRYILLEAKSEGFPLDVFVRPIAVMVFIGHWANYYTPLQAITWRTSRSEKITRCNSSFQFKQIGCIQRGNTKWNIAYSGYWPLHARIIRNEDEWSDLRNTTLFRTRCVLALKINQFYLWVKLQEKPTEYTPFIEVFDDLFIIRSIKGYRRDSWMQLLEMTIALVVNSLEVLRWQLKRSEKDCLFIHSRLEDV